MIEVSIDRADLRTWLVCEAGQRWISAVRRFSPGLMPPPLVPSIIAAESATAMSRATALRGHRAIILWESSGESLLPVCDRLIQASQANPQALQLVAAGDRTDREQAILLELPCTAILRHPEDLAGLKSMIRSYFQADRRS
jgi:hypothetical protein